MENSSGSPDDVLGGPRLVFLTGSREPDGVTGGQAAALYDLYPDGEQMFLNAVEYYIPAKMWDITAPGDIVKGVPDQPETDWNDIGWPPAENPSMCIDDNTGTKYLHFAGDIQPTGVQITPLDGPSIVTGITLTTANDAPERDPITFELYGSNVSIDGPYELIAAGDVVDFAGEEAWLRYTKNATPIMFDNDKSYAHYQLMFPTVRDPVAQDSMQIAEVELLGVLTILPRTLTISSTGGGFVITPGEGAFTYEDGTEVEVKAVADENFYFLKWTGSAVDAGKVDPGSASITILMDGDYSLKAHFAANLAVSSTNGGSVTTPGEGTFSYEHGSDVPVEATADEYYYFLKWTGSAVDAGKVADPGSASTTVLVDGEYDLKANFAAVSFKLTVSSTDGGSVIKPGEGDIVIGGNYLIPLEVEADQNYKFVNWTGSAVDAGMVVDPDSPITSIFVLGNYNVKAHFAIDTHILTISSTEGGSVTTPGEGAFEYDHGAEVSVVATPDEHYHFVGWTGSAVDAGKVADPGSASTTVTADGDYTLIANFEIDKHTLTISSNNCGSVTTPGEGVFEYDYGTVVDLAATADPDYRFKFWTGPVADLLSASTTVTITEDITVSAVFVKSKPLPPNDS